MQMPHSEITSSYRLQNKERPAGLPAYFYQVRYFYGYTFKNGADEMTGKERRKKILRLAATNGNLSARALAEQFSVSRMTINRDLRSLEKAGRVRCIHGGAIPVIETQQRTIAPPFCTGCDEPLMPHQRYFQQFEDQAENTFCCACCGLKAQLLNPEPGNFCATDMISGKTLPADDAYFLISSSATPCCQPSILTFADQSEVITFRSSFGGVVARVAEALDFLRTAQNLETTR